MRRTSSRQVWASKSCYIETCRRVKNRLLRDPWSGVCYRCIKYCMQRVELLQSSGVVPVVVFDGGRLPMKNEEEAARKRHGHTLIDIQSTKNQQEMTGQ